LRFPRIVPDRYLISVALNRRHLTEGQKAVLANNYSTILSEKLSSDAGKIKANARWHPDKEYSSETVSEQHDEKMKNDARKIASERWKVSERKVRIAHEIEKKTINIKWHSNNLSDVITVISSDKDEVSDTKKAINVR